MLLFVLVLLLIAAAIALVIRAVAVPRMRMAAHLRQIDVYGFNANAADADVLEIPPPLGRSINALAEGVGRAAMTSVPILTPIPNRVLSSAGYFRISSEAFHGYRIIATVALPALLLFEALAAGLNGGLTVLAHDIRGSVGMGGVRRSRTASKRGKVASGRCRTPRADRRSDRDD